MVMQYECSTIDMVIVAIEKECNCNLSHEQKTNLKKTCKEAKAKSVERRVNHKNQGGTVTVSYQKECWLVKFEKE